MTDERDRLEDAYAAACRAVESAAYPTDEQARAVDVAWDRLSELCDDLGECKATRCRVKSPEFAYCEAHRVC